MYSFWYTFIKTLGCGAGKMKMTPRNIILITGCDSGLGHSLALYCHTLNMTVISACHNINSEGAHLLRNLNDPKRMITIEVDLLKQETITHAFQYVTDLLRADSEYQFTALVNNAGVMCFGEFEWQTTAQFEMQINVNVLGTMRLTKELLPLVRQHRGRIINITSHCGLQALPALSPYAASKAALRFWNDSLRMEMRQYGVEVINFVPGSFVHLSNISARQQDHAKVMLDAFNDEQRQLYGAYFKQFNNYLTVISGFKAPNQFRDDRLLEKFNDALTNRVPRAIYIHEPWRYKLYRFLFYICPTPIVDRLTVKFCAMPTYQQVMETSEQCQKN
ncbi:PREDICTED: D-beta-hydroxybutyrate dehydrogenase, mitochondrial [Rhagoletis zephyria]|uniref:D-beta-hydroxybutyrate dehydrogenase, mitochondrial n=1 Tax=Rhagoletis zephyria TaxID=28612 RepID=UPI000811A7A5|nr:PREDICTED: D-beta-hydroxybutyrate dehydrogenase, mitochondrial [Rhagoletis zephyria]XP_017475093.1 PREDICTED: D-beta-hydroxybutyrate dehydrogenase, mitochondrial [Rhagoletis zephyria]